jgi:Lipopolysaccharide-assembly
MRAPLAELVRLAAEAGAGPLSRRRFTLLAACSPLAAMLGCANYQVGRKLLYPADITTVYVPLIESNSYRRGLGEWLTEAVIKEIDNVTPFKVVNSELQADSVLTCRIQSDTKQIAMLSPTNEGRELQVTFHITVDWRDSKGELVQPSQSIPGPAALNNPLQNTANMYTEIGQSVTSAQQTVIQELARQIVSMMEAPW